MKTSPFSRRNGLLGLVSAGVVVIAVASSGYGGGALADDPPLAVFVGTDSPVGDISRSALRRAFLGEPTVVEGVKLLPLNQNPGTPDRIRFDKGALDLLPDAVSRFWIDQRIRGEGNPPRSIPSVELLLKLASHLPGVIAYARITDVPPGSVKILTIDGKKPGAPGYLLN
ncbi:MAG: hypothetical protein ABI560_07105 [Myxococcales bacterium]